MISIDQYHRMIDAGIFTEDDPVELLEGLVVRKLPKNPPHRRAKRRLLNALARMILVGWYVEEQEPIALDTSAPEPDVFIARGSPDDYRDRDPGPADLALVVEIAQSSLERDRGMKKRIYARANIRVYWIVNLVDGIIEQYTDPSGPAEAADYRVRRDLRLDDETPLVLDGVEVGRLFVREILD